MAFRIGRKFASHTYPETPRAAPAAFARNSAVRKGSPITITDTFAEISWTIIESNGGSGVDVPITPSVTGVVRLLVVLVVSNVSSTPTNVFVQARVNHVTQTFPAIATTVDARLSDDPPIPGLETVTYLLDGVLVPVGVPYNIEIYISTTPMSGDELNLADVTLDIQELPLATG